MYRLAGFFSLLLLTAACSGSDDEAQRVIDIDNTTVISENDGVLLTRVNCNGVIDWVSFRSLDDYKKPKIFAACGQAEGSTQNNQVRMIPLPAGNYKISSVGNSSGAALNYSNMKALKFSIVPGSMRYIGDIDATANGETVVDISLAVSELPCDATVATAMKMAPSFFQKMPVETQIAAIKPESTPIVSGCPTGAYQTTTQTALPDNEPPAAPSPVTPVIIEEVSSSSQITEPTQTINQNTTPPLNAAPKSTSIGVANNSTSGVNEDINEEELEYGVILASVTCPTFFNWVKPQRIKSAKKSETTISRAEDDLNCRGRHSNNRVTTSRFIELPVGNYFLKQAAGSHLFRLTYEESNAFSFKVSPNSITYIGEIVVDVVSNGATENDLELKIDVYDMVSESLGIAFSKDPDYEDEDIPIEKMLWRPVIDNKLVKRKTTLEKKQVPWIKDNSPASYF